MDPGFRREAGFLVIVSLREITHRQTISRADNRR
jgi:hypothetical protein